jgi:UDP-N-acetylmuramate: L-alanyl-gamma-D-glutamyl-meso-diaminopimelate ligase
VAKAFESIGTKTGVFQDLDAMVQTIVSMARPRDHILVMSNGGFGGVHGKLLAKLAEREMAGK